MYLIQMLVFCNAYLSHPSETSNYQYFFISNDNDDKVMQSTLNKMFPFNTTLNFKCIDLLWQTSTSYRTCQENATWSGLDPIDTSKSL